MVTCDPCERGEDDDRVVTANDALGDKDLKERGIKVV